MLLLLSVIIQIRAFPRQRDALEEERKSSRGTLTAANSGELTCASCEKRKCDTCVARLSTFAAIIDGVLLRERVPETSLQVKAGAFRWEFSECRMKWKVVSRDVHLLY